jgi:murein DD-endopeptidase MepM/ murein hydrolase activator NlpD
MSGCVSSEGGLKIYSGYGSMTTPAGGPRPSWHRGVDLAGEVGQPIIASADGTVVLSGALGDYGIRIDLKHHVVGEPSAYTVHGHLQRPILEYGDKVKRGQVIGHIGTTGLTSFRYSHVHYEVKIGGPIDPTKKVVGCFDPMTKYPDDKLILTWPLRC